MDAQLHHSVKSPKPAKDALPTMGLHELKWSTIAALNYLDHLNRPLLLVERQAFRILLVAWESKPIKKALRGASEKQLDEFESLIVRLRILVNPDPPKKIRLQRNKAADMEADLHDGNYAPKVPMYAGVSVPRLTKREVAERVSLLTQLSAGCAVLCRELAIAHGGDAKKGTEILCAAADQMKLAKRMIALNEEFRSLVKGSALPKEISVEESIDNARTMGQLLGAASE